MPATRTALGAQENGRGPERPAARILIVDDETAHLEALCDALGSQGYSTSGFSSARAALAGLLNAEFDVVLTDLKMPEIDGIAFLQSARETDPDLVAVMMTGEGSIATAVEAMKAGAFDYVLKPFSLTAILPVLVRAISVRRLRTENAELQRSVSERTAELEAANKELEAFSYSVSHDLRAPLRQIAGFSEILMEDYASQLPEEAVGLLTSVLGGTRRMSRLIEDLLAFSRLGRQTVSKQQVEPSAIVREVLAELDSERNGRSVEISVGTLPRCAADPALLRQVFANLLSNALKFTRGKEKAAIEVGSLQGEDERIYFVRDNGAGFDMKHADRLFGVFQRLHGYSEFEGTGVGLSIVHRIIQRHGGRIWAEAAPNLGAKFYFALPEIKAKENPA